MSNYIIEAFKKCDLLESEDISLDVSGMTELRSFLDDAAVDPDEEINIYDLQAEAEEDLQQTYEGKVILECTVCHSHIFEDKENISVDEDGTACKDIECPYCMSNEGYFIIGEIAPFNQEKADEFSKDEEDELDEVDIEGAADDIDDEDLVESLKIKVNQKLNEDVRLDLSKLTSLERLLRNQINDVVLIIKDYYGINLEDYVTEIVLESGGMEDFSLKFKFKDGHTLEYYINAIDGIDVDNVVDDLYYDFEEKGIIIEESYRRRKSRRSLKESIESSLDKAFRKNINVLVNSAPGKDALSAIRKWCKNNQHHVFQADVLAYDLDDVKSLLGELDKYDVVVLDNLNRAPQEIGGALLSVIREAPCMVIGVTSGNPPIDPAFKSRFYKVDVNESMKLDGIKELYDNDEIRGVEELEGVDELEGVKELHGDKHEAPINESMDLDELTKLFLKYHEDADNYRHNPYGFEKMYEILLKYGDETENVDEVFKRAPYSEQVEMVNLITPSSDISESIKRRKNKKLKEDIEDVSVTTEDEVMTMTTKDDGGVVIETSPKEDLDFEIDDEEFNNLDTETDMDSEGEMIVPISDETSEVIDVASDALDSEDNEDFNEVKNELESDEEMSDEEFSDDFEEFDEESFDNLGESYLKNCYSNVKGFKTTGVSTNNGKLFVEGIIKFDSNNIKETQFVFESLGNGKFEGYNKQISRGKKTYKLSGTVKNNKLFCESLNYNYRSKNELNESVRVYGTVKRK